MVMKKSIYIAGPRMGQNNSMYGIELKKAPKPAKSSRASKGKARNQIMSKYLQNIVSPSKEEPSKKAAATKKVTGSKKARKKTQEK